VRGLFVFHFLEKSLDNRIGDTKGDTYHVDERTEAYYCLLCFIWDLYLGFENSPSNQLADIPAKLTVLLSKSTVIIPKIIFH
jgi:hypothetical protein